MADAVIVSTARTGIGKAFKGSLNLTHGAEMGGHVIKHAVERAGVDPDAVEDVIMGSSLLEGTTGGNIARRIALTAGLPVHGPGVSVNRFCASGLQTVAMVGEDARAHVHFARHGRRGLEAVRIDVRIFDDAVHLHLVSAYRLRNDAVGAFRIVRDDGESRTQNVVADIGSIALAHLDIQILRNRTRLKFRHFSFFPFV